MAHLYQEKLEKEVDDIGNKLFRVKFDMERGLDLEQGDDLFTKLTSLVKGSRECPTDCVLLILPKGALTSRAVRHEVKVAVENHIPIIGLHKTGFREDLADYQAKAKKSLKNKVNKIPIIPEEYVNFVNNEVVTFEYENTRLRNRNITYEKVKRALLKAKPRQYTVQLN